MNWVLIFKLFYFEYYFFEMVLMDWDENIIFFKENYFCNIICFVCLYLMYVFIVLNEFGIYLDVKFFFYINRMKVINISSVG